MIEKLAEKEFWPAARSQNLVETHNSGLLAITYPIFKIIYVEICQCWVFKFWACIYMRQQHMRRIFLPDFFDKWNIIIIIFLFLLLILVHIWCWRFGISWNRVIYSLWYSCWNFRHFKTLKGKGQNSGALNQAPWMLLLTECNFYVILHIYVDGARMD